MIGALIHYFLALTPMFQIWPVEQVRTAFVGVDGWANQEAFHLFQTITFFVLLNSLLWWRNYVQP